MNTAQNFDLTTIITPLQDIELNISRGIHDDGSLGKVRCNKANIKGVGEVKVTERFMTSLAGLMGIGPSVYRYFEPEEVFERVVKTSSRNSMVKVSVDHNNQLLAAISPNKEALGTSVFRSIMDGTTPRSYKYENGVIKFLYDVHHNGGMTIAGEDYKKQFTMTIPLDGYGHAHSNLGLLRQICSNGMELLTPIFSGRVGLGTKGDRSSAFINYVQNFNNDESFSIVEDRLVTAAASPASLGEYARLLRALQLGHGLDHKELDRQLYNAINDIAGDPMKKYGLVSFDSLSDKKLMLLNTDCKVYDLVHFATEVNSHKYNEGDLFRRRIAVDNYISELITNEYDMEVAKMVDYTSTKLNGRQFFLN